MKNIINKVKDFFTKIWGNEKSRFTLIGVLILLFIGLGAIIYFNFFNFLDDEPNNQNNEEIVFYEYDDLFESNFMVVYESKGINFKEDNKKIIEDFKKEFNVPLTIFYKEKVTEEEYKEIYPKGDYKKWLENDSAIYIKNKKLVKTGVSNGIKYGSVPSDINQDFLYNFLLENKLFDETIIKDQIEEISLEQYYTLVKETEDYGSGYNIVFSDGIKDLYTIIKEGKDEKINFGVLDLSKLTDTEKEKLYNTSTKFYRIKNELPFVGYLLSEDTIICASATRCQLSAGKESYQTSDYYDGELTINAYESVLNTINYLSNVKSVDFTKVGNDMLKAKIVLDIIDYHDYETVTDPINYFDGKAIVSKEHFMKKAIKVFGPNFSIDISKTGDVWSGESCVGWEYNSSLEQFERDYNGCGGIDEFNYYTYFQKSIVETSTQYIFTKKYAYVIFDGDNEDFAINHVEADTIIGRSANNKMAEQIFLDNNASKFDSIRFTFTKSNGQIYISKFEQLN